MNRQTAEERYMHDPQFRKLVDLMASFYERLDFTPSDMREAAMFAALKVEMRTIRPMFVRNGETLLP